MPFHMKHPLVMAMKRRRTKPTEALPEAPRIMEFRTSELPSNGKLGHPLVVTLRGKIKSMHDDGRAMVEVHKVTPQQEESDDGIQKTPKTKVLTVQTQESHAP